MADVIADLLVRVGADITGMQTGIDTASGKLASFGATATQVGLDFAKLGAPLTAFGGLAAKTAGDFEASMNVLAVAAGGGGASLEDLRSTAIKAGADVTLVGVSASDVANAMTNFTKAGLSTNDMLGNMQGYLDGTAQLGGALRAAIDLAAASELDLDQASTLVTTTMSTFGLSADEVVGAMNNYVQSADASVASVSDLAAAMENIGPTMAAFGFSLEDVNTALAILSTRGIVGAEAGTALKSMFTNLMSGTPEVTKVLNDLNVSLYDQNGAMKPLPDIIAQLSNATRGMTDEQRNATVQILAGSYGQKAMNTLLAEGTTGWNGMKTAIGDAATMQESAAARTVGFNAAMENLKSTIETFLINVGTPLIQDVLTPLVAKLSDVMQSLSGVNPKFTEFAIIAGGLVTGLGLLLVAVGQISTGISGLITIGGALAPVLGGIVAAAAPIVVAFAPVLAVIAAVAAAIAVLALAWNNNWFGIRDTLTAVWEQSLKPALEQVRKWLEETITRAIQAVSGFWTNTLVPAMRSVWDFINNSLVPLFRSVANVLDAVVGVAVTALAGLWQKVLYPALVTIWNFIQTTLGPVFQWLADKVLAPVQKAVEAVKLGFSLLVSTLSLALQPVLTTIQTIFEKVQAALTAIPGKIQDVTNWFNNLADKLRNLKLPDWLTPGSPTPLEVALYGILGAIRAVAGGPWGWIDPLLRLFGGGAGGGQTININVTVGPDAVKVEGADPQQLASAVGEAIWRALKALVTSETLYGAGGTGGSGYTVPW